MDDINWTRSRNNYYTFIVEMFKGCDAKHPGPNLFTSTKSMIMRDEEASRMRDENLQCINRVVCF